MGITQNSLGTWVSALNSMSLIKMVTSKNLWVLAGPGMSWQGVALGMLFVPQQLHCLSPIACGYVLPTCPCHAGVVPIYSAVILSSVMSQMFNNIYGIIPPCWDSENPSLDEPSHSAKPS